MLHDCYMKGCKDVSVGPSPFPVAQLNRAFDYGSKGFRFES